MFTTTRWIGPGALSLLVAFCVVGCPKPPSCRDAPECKKMGKCTVGPKRVCIIASDADCQQSDPCRIEGRCSFKDKRCVAGSNEECQASEHCQKAGLCEAVDGACVNLAREFQPACAGPCRADGLCVQRGGKCVALSDYHCRSSSDTKPDPESVCAREGRCTARGDVCVAASDEDCAKSAACRRAGRCG